MTNPKPQGGASYIKYKNGFLLNEIRFGPSYEIVILGTVPTTTPQKEEE